METEEDQVAKGKEGKDGGHAAGAAAPAEDRAIQKKTGEKIAQQPLEQQEIAKLVPDQSDYQESHSNSQISPLVGGPFTRKQQNHGEFPNGYSNRAAGASNDDTA